MPASLQAPTSAAAVSAVSHPFACLPPQNFFRTTNGSWACCFGAACPKPLGARAPGPVTFIGFVYLFRLVARLISFRQATRRTACVLVLTRSGNGFLHRLICFKIRIITSQQGFWGPGPKPLRALGPNPSSVGPDTVLATSACCTN